MKGMGEAVFDATRIDTFLWNRNSAKLIIPLRSFKSVLNPLSYCVLSLLRSRSLRPSVMQ